MSKITHEQAIALWRRVSCGVPVGVDNDFGPIHADTEFWSAICVLTAGRERPVYAWLHPKEFDSTPGEGPNYNKINRDAVAAFLREFADAIEGD